MAKPAHVDVVGYWSEIKLEIIKLYAAAYSVILTAQKSPPLHHVYIDAFAGTGAHISKATGAFVVGSPLNALAVQPPFREYFLIDLDNAKVDLLRQVVGNRQDVHVLGGDCNVVLSQDVLPKVRYEDFRRGLCLLDPYGLHFKWTTIDAIAKTKAIDTFLNFSIYDANLNVLLKDPEKADPEQQARLTDAWGDESWRGIAYSPDLLGIPRKEPNPAIAKGFQERLRNVAGFAHVPDPLPMRNTKGAIVYYLFFASHKPVAKQIVEDIFQRHGKRRG